MRGGGGSYSEDLDELKLLRRAADQAELAFALKAGEFAAREEFQDPLYDTAIQELRRECRMTVAAAANAITVGEYLDKLPVSCAAMAAGDVGFAHLVQLAYTAKALNESKTACSFNELDLLPKAVRSTVIALRHACANYRHSKDPEGYVRQEVIDVQERYLFVKTTPEGAGVSLNGMFDLEAGALIEAALSPLTQKQGETDQRRAEHRYADALVELVGVALDSGRLPVQGGVRPHVQISATVETLARLANAPGAELELGLPISAEALRRHACDCSLTRVLLDSDSLVIDVGRAKRTIAPAQRAALLKRDAGCRFPGCERSGRYCEGHHLKHWAKGGETVMKNLVLLCRRHHFLVHEGGWELNGGVQKGFVAIPPRPWWLSDLPAA